MDKVDERAREQEIEKQIPSFGESISKIGELPKDHDTEVVIGIAGRIVVDIPAVGIEVADVDAVAVRIGNLHRFLP